LHVLDRQRCEGEMPAAGGDPAAVVAVDVLPGVGETYREAAGRPGSAEWLFLKVVAGQPDAFVAEQHRQAPAAPERCVKTLQQIRGKIVQDQDAGGTPLPVEQ